MPAMRMMQMSLHQVIRMIAVRHPFMSAVRSMHMAGFVRSAIMLGRALGLIRPARLQRMFVHVVSMDMVQMAVM